MYFKKIINKRYVLFLIIVLLILTDTFILLDVPVLRLIFGFAFYLIIPGYIIIYLLNLNRIGILLGFVLSWGLSISFIVFSVLLMSYLYPLFGYNEPLSTNSLVISISIILLMLIGTIFWKNEFNSFIDISDFNLNTREKAFLLIPTIFPFIGIIGMHIMNTRDDNAMLVSLHLLIIAYVIFISLNYKHVPERVYAPLIFLISTSIVLLLGLRSSHIIGADIHIEYYIFQQTVLSSQWNMIFNSTIDTCLSISILPAVYQSFLGIDPEYTFKVLYPILMSVCPLIIYIICKKYIECRHAFLASVFFLSQHSFLWVAYGPRTRLAVLFFALAIMILFSDELDEAKKKFFFIIFALSCIVSHYSTTYIFFFLLLGILVGTQIIRCSSKKSQIIYMIKLHKYSKSSTTIQGISCSLLKSHFTTGMLVLVFVAIFLWYSQITGEAFETGIQFIGRSLLSLQDFFIMESRSENVQAVLGRDLEAKGIPQKIEFIFSWLSIAFIAVGVLTTLARYRQCVAVDDTLSKRPHSSLLYRRLDAEFFAASVICSALLVISIAFPFVLIGYGMDRMFFQMMVILSLFFVIGGITIAELLRFHKSGHLLVLSVLIIFFMSTTGIINQIFDDPKSMIFNSEGDLFDIYYIYDKETVGAIWLKKFSDEKLKIYSDNFGQRRLVSQGGLIRDPVYAPSIVEILNANRSIEDGYIYLRRTAVIDGKLLDNNIMWHNIFDYQKEILTRNLIYSNNGSQVWL